LKKEKEKIYVNTQNKRTTMEDEVFYCTSFKREWKRFFADEK